MPNVNAYARRRRLGQVIRYLREQAGMTHAALAKASGVSSPAISRLENALVERSKPNLISVRSMLDVLGVERRSELRETIEQMVHDGAARAWWDTPTHANMGKRQRGLAAIEDGAATIDEYSPLVLPGLVQTRAYARNRASAAATHAPHAEAIVSGRLRRQQLLDDGATRYRLVLEEATVRRRPPGASAELMVEQLDHLMDLAQRPMISIRIIPVDALISDGLMPTSPYAHITYPHPDDPPIVVVDTVTADLLVTEPDEVSGYAQLHQELRGAALSDADSVELIRQVAGKLAASI